MKISREVLLGENCMNHLSSLRGIEVGQVIMVNRVIENYVSHTKIEDVVELEIVNAKDESDAHKVYVSMEDLLKYKMPMVVERESVTLPVKVEVVWCQQDAQGVMDFVLGKAKY